ncbi:MAG: S-methyl-5-thioribose kinase [Bacillota bacterium]|nr:S-methyl-5-thioribose kinase [Bacillota bacterium]
MFSKYRKLNEEDSIKYIKEKMDVFGKDERLISREIGDGNINYIFQINSQDSNFSVVIKQADKKLRSSGRDLDTDRIRIEAEALNIEGELSKGMVPKIYLYDREMRCIIMEDLSKYQIMRKALVERKIIKNFSENISDFLLNTMLPTTDLVNTPMEKKKMVKKFINPELCDISERLVFTDPYRDIEENTFQKMNKNFVEGKLYKDEKLHLEVAKLKIQFMTNAQALIHGDLHTGSIFVKDDKIKIIDSEFAFYGPMGYDVGNIVANLFFAEIRNLVLNEKSNQFDKWITETIKNTVDLFKIKFINYLENNTKEKIAITNKFFDWYLDEVLGYTAGAAGLEMIRRIVGEAKVEDIESIKDSELKGNAERIGIKIAKELIMNRNKIKTGKNYLDIADEMIMEELNDGKIR